MNRKRITRVRTLVSSVLKSAVFYPMGKLCFGNKHIWLVGERPWQAQDNGYRFFQYLKENHPEQKVFYVITKDSPKLKAVAEIGDVIYYGSIKHWLMYFGSEALISTHIRKLVPTDNWTFGKLTVKFKQKNQKLVFLQHGVISADIPALYSEHTRLDLFICGAKPEYDYVKEHFHYKNNEVVYTGLARYDALHDIKTKKQIMIMPTWRTWLSNLSDEDLRNSEYIRMWNLVITDPEFLSAAEDAGYRIIFYPHPEMQAKKDLFVSLSENLIIAGENEYEIQTLLKESALLITDFSSVFFDFAYMRKPMLFFQFDKERHAAEHYHKGYFDYERDGFGRVAYTPRALVDAFREIMMEGVSLSENYSRRIDRFFPLYDQNNSERIYQEIENLLKG